MTNGIVLKSPNNAVRAALYEIFELRSDLVTLIEPRQQNRHPKDILRLEQYSNHLKASRSMLMRVAQIDDRILERAGRYETVLWRQAARRS